MPLLKPAKRENAYLKAGLFGDAGSGKTFSATKIALGLSNHIGSKKPIAMFDTEAGSDYILDMIEKTGGELVRIKSRSAVDLCGVMSECSKEEFILIVDSITHVWDEFTQAYKKKKRQNYIELWDWKPIKDEWRRVFTDPYLNSPAHIILCGRAGAIYETTEEDRGGKIRKQSVKVGTKMRSEAESGYEPSLLIEMEKIFSEGTGQYARRGTVIKDRFAQIDSRSFDNPTFEHILPHIKRLNLGGNQHAIDTTRTSESLFTDRDRSYALLKERREIALEEIKHQIVMAGLDGSGKVEKANRAAMLEKIFGTGSWTAISNLKVPDLENKVSALKERLRLDQSEKTEHAPEVETVDTGVNGQGTTIIDGKKYDNYTGGEVG